MYQGQSRNPGGPRKRSALRERIRNAQWLVTYGDWGAYCSRLSPAGVAAYNCRQWPSLSWLLGFTDASGTAYYGIGVTKSLPLVVDSRRRGDLNVCAGDLHMLFRSAAELVEVFFGVRIQDAHYSACLDVPFPQIVEELTEMTQLAARTHSSRTVEQIVDVPVPTSAELNLDTLFGRPL